MLAFIFPWQRKFRRYESQLVNVFTGGGIRNSIYDAFFRPPCGSKGTIRLSQRQHFCSKIIPASLRRSLNITTGCVTEKMRAHIYGKKTWHANWV